MIIFFLALNFASAGPVNLIAELTQATILARVGAKQCHVSEDSQPFLGAALEALYDAEAVAFKRQSAGPLGAVENCVADCSCYALSRALQEDRDQKTREGQLRMAQVEKKLTLMTDADYTKCSQAVPLRCESKYSLKLLKKLHEISGMEPKR